MPSLSSLTKAELIDLIHQARLQRDVLHHEIVEAIMILNDSDRVGCGAIQGLTNASVAAEGWRLLD